MDKKPESLQELGWLRTLSSILASVAGVASRRRFEEDVRRGSFRRYIIVVVILMLGFVLLHVILLKLILHYAGQ